ncbi:MAG: hypothetical protein FWH19_00790 [Treponema sp.]|nr:hypothetical protein [Treponema sp.]
MSTIPTTFNDDLPSYTAVGGNERRASTGLSAVILNRGGRYLRFGLFEELKKAGFDYVLSMESSFARYDLEALSQSFPFVRFILIKEPLSTGEEINLAAAELSSPLFFVLWNDLKILRGGGAERMAERLLSGGGASHAEQGSTIKRLCTVPVIQDGRFETMPTRIVPALMPERKLKTDIKTIPFVPAKEGLASLYPFDGIGIYDRERFIRLGGFDASIKKFYWQLMDFGFRARLWGEEIAATLLVKLSYEGAIPQEDSTAGESWRRFFLKNLAPVFRRDYAHIPLARFPDYFKRRGELFTAWEEFTAARSWVKTNRYRFCSDARTVTERWETFKAAGSEKEASSNEEEL